MLYDDDPDWRRFWAAYPRRVAKKEARKAWAQICPTSEQVDAMIAALAWQVRQPAWTRGHEFIPHPASWLRAERWEDEPPVVDDVWAQADRLLQGRTAS